MSATFQIKVHRVFTKDEGDYKNVIKRIEWTLQAFQSGVASPYAPQTTEVTFVNPSNFTAYEDLTEEMVVAWIEANCPQLGALKVQLQNYLDKQLVLSTYQTPALPWPYNLEDRPMD